MLNLDFADANDVLDYMDDQVVRFNTPDTVGRCHLEHAPRWARSEPSEKPLRKMRTDGLGGNK